MSGEVWQSAQLAHHLLNESWLYGIEDHMPKPERPRGIPVTRADQVTIVAVAVGILVITGFLVALLF